MEAKRRVDGVCCHMMIKKCLVDIQPEFFVFLCSHKKKNKKKGFVEGDAWDVIDASEKRFICKLRFAN